ncbi:MAG: 30S ribosomal protein S20 [Candidatus Brocadiaceae bacterium]|jgi:small subunit ribosomal protein S20
MPNRPSALKRLRQDRKRTRRNRAVKSRLRTEENKMTRMLERGDVEEAEQQLRVLTRLLHRAASKNIIHKNKAARKQAQFQRRLNELGQQSPA